METKIVYPTAEMLAKITKAAQNSVFLQEKKEHAMRFAKQIVAQIQQERQGKQA